MATRKLLDSLDAQPHYRLMTAEQAVKILDRIFAEDSKSALEVSLSVSLSASLPLSKSLSPPVSFSLSLSLSLSRSLARALSLSLSLYTHTHTRTPSVILNALERYVGVLKCKLVAEQLR